MNIGNVLARCSAIKNTNYIKALYKGQSIIKLHKIDGYANRASRICHYCSVDVLKEIIEKGCLRFTDVRFLNDSTEFVEILEIIKSVLQSGNYDSEFVKFILDSNTFNELENYKQSYLQINEGTKSLEAKKYHVYTCSFSNNGDSLNMWNYYAKNEGVNIYFDFVGSVFKEIDGLKPDQKEKINNDVIMYSGPVIYELEDKKKCITELLDQLQNLYMDAGDGIDKYKQYIYEAFKGAVNNTRCFFKNKYFRNEEEYRVVLEISEDMINSKCGSGKINNIGFFKRSNVLIPYIDYKICRKSIKRITMNPYVENNSVFELGIKELLWANDLEEVRVVKSNIPVRKYD